MPGDGPPRHTGPSAGRDAGPGASRHLDLVREELRDLAASVIPDGAGEPFGLYLFPGRHPAAELGRHVERAVFQEYFGNSPELLAEEYEPYDDASLFFTVLDHRRRLPAGVLRVITPNDAGFKTLHDIERIWGQPVDELLSRTRADIEPERMWDVATLAVDRDYRGAATEGLVSLALYQGFSQGALRSGVRWLVAILDVVALDLVQSVTERPFHYFPHLGPKRYLDSPSSVPVWIDSVEWLGRVERANPDMHAILVGGANLGPAIRLPDWDEVVELVGRSSPRGFAGPSLLTPVPETPGDTGATGTEPGNGTAVNRSV